MYDTHVTLTGTVGTAVTVRTVGEHQVSTFRVAVNPRRLNRATGEWTSGQTHWYTVNAWRQLGANVAQSLQVGDAVVVYGRLSQKNYTTSTNQEASASEVDAFFVGHDLNRGTTTLVKTSRRQPEAESEDVAA